ncbi:hypothetical protein SKC41_31510 [Mycobacterium sp. 050128]|nr:hypothetical protein L842_5991 [Mycobacterium intracellulare MIN_052511_1280]
MNRLVLMVVSSAALTHLRQHFDKSLAGPASYHPAADECNV